MERKLVEVPYEWLKRATNGFGDKSFGCKGGFKLGKGGFGEVFYVKIGIEGKGKFECAVKKIMSDVVTDDFEKEVDVMKKCVNCKTSSRLVTRTQSTLIITVTITYMHMFCEFSPFLVDFIILTSCRCLVFPKMGNFPALYIIT